VPGEFPPGTDGKPQVLRFISRTQAGTEDY